MQKPKYIGIFLAGLILGSVAFGPSIAAANRDWLYRQFGERLIQAFAMVVKGEINILRAEHTLPARTDQQIMNSFSNELVNVPPFPWE